MSLGALQLQSLFRKYQGELADIDLNAADSKRNYDRTKRDLRESRRLGTRNLADSMAGRGMAHSGVHLERRADMERQFTNANADADAQRRADLNRIAKARLKAKGDYDEGVALSKLTSMLDKIG